MTTLKAVTESCMRGFALVCHALEQDALSKKTSYGDDMREEFGRFKIWTGNLGAMAKGHSALDWRLRDADVMRSTVFSLLEELQGSLELAFEAVHHGSPDVVLGAEATDDDDPLDDISLPSDDDLEVIDLPMNGLSYLTQTIQDLVKDLYKLSFRIRNSTTKPTRAIHYKEIDVSSGLEIFGDCYAALDKKHIFELFRSLRKGSQLLDEDDDVLIERLARSNTARRRQFRYWQKHAQKFTPTEPLALVTVNALALEPVPESVKANPDPKVFANTHVSESHHSKTILTATEATHFDPQLDLTSLETQSITSFATTARDLEGRPAELPPPPAAASNNRDFVCPYCYVLCPARHDNGRAWRTHIVQDLSPYVCTYISCTTPDRLYGSRREWIEHEEQQHRRRWVCRFHPLLQFLNQESLEYHLHRESHEGLTDDNIRDFASISHLVTDDFRLLCPICLEETERITQFPAHIAHHMERIAIFALPSIFDCDDELANVASDEAVPHSRAKSAEQSLNSDMHLSFSNEDSDEDLLPEIEEHYSFEEVLDWLSPDAFRQQMSRTVASMNAPSWEKFITGDEYRAWVAGDPLWRMYCCGSDLSRLSTFSSSVHAEIERTLPSNSAVVALFMPEVATQTDLAHSFLASLIGQLLGHLRRQRSLQDIPLAISNILCKTGAGGPLPSVQIIREALGQLLASFRRVYVILDNVGDYWDNGFLPLWTVILGPRFANLSLMLTMQTYQNPSMTTSCSACGKKELLLYWHCTTCKGGNFDSCSTCHEGGLGCQDLSHRNVLTDVQQEKTVVDVDSLYTRATHASNFARRIDLELLAINQRNLSRAESEEALMIHYNNIFDIISSSKREPLVIKALDIVYHTIRPLSVKEILAVINMCQESSVFEISQIVTWSGELIKVVKDQGGTPCVQFFDSSLIEYLGKKKDKLFPAGHSTLAIACLQVLLGSERLQAEVVLAQITVPILPYSAGDFQATTSLYNYAACMWGHHLRACSSASAIEDIAMQYLENKERFTLGTMTASGLQRGDKAYGLDIGHGLAPVHVCSLFGLTNLLQRIPSTEFDRQAPVTGRTPLAYACKMGHVDTVEFLLKSGADPNMVFSLRSSTTHKAELTVLHEAIKSKHLPVVETLLRSSSVKLTPFSLGENKNVPFLTFLLQLGSIEILRLAFGRNDLDINETDSTGRTILWWLIDETHEEYSPEFQLSATRLILQHRGCDVNAVDSGGRTCIMQFLGARSINSDLLCLLLDHGADVNQADEEGETAIYYAVTLRYSLEITLILLDRGADLKIRNFHGEGLAHRIITSLEDVQDLEYLDLLIKRMPGLIESRDDSGRTPLHLALVLGKIYIARELLTWVVDVSSLDHFGRTAFDIACQYGRIPAFDHDNTYCPPLPGSGPDRMTLAEAQDLAQQLTPKDFKAMTPLPAWSLTYSENFDQLLRRLKDGKLDMLEASPDDWNTALHHLMRPCFTFRDSKTQEEILEIYFKTSKECNPRNIRQQTPLHIAVYGNRLGMAQMLLENGANPKARDISGKTPLDLAKALNNTVMRLPLEIALRSQKSSVTGS